MKNIIIKDDNPTLTTRTESMLINLDKRIKSLKEVQDKLRNDLLNEMKKKNIYQVETDFILLTYVAPTTRESLDTKALRKDNPDIYDSYINITNVNESLRVKIK